jgi:hypothetical protein
MLGSGTIRFAVCARDKSDFNTVLPARTDRTRVFVSRFAIQRASSAEVTVAIVDTQLIFDSLLRDIATLRPLIDAHPKHLDRDKMPADGQVD